MTFDQELTFITTVSGENDLGDPILSAPIERTVLCSEKSVNRSEHYAPAAKGLRPEVVLEVHKDEYLGEKELLFQGKRMMIMRTFKPRYYKGIDDFETIELICTGRINHVNA